VFLIKYTATTIAAFLTLALFDDNPRWLVALFCLLPALISTKWKESWGAGAPAALIKGGSAAFLAFVAGVILPNFRTTFGTLVGFTILVAAAEYFLLPLFEKR